MIRTHKNSDGTYDASVNGHRLGLRCIFWFSARSVAMSRIARIHARYEILTRDFDTSWTACSILDVEKGMQDKNVRGWNVYKVERKSYDGVCISLCDHKFHSTIREYWMKDCVS